MSRLPKLEIVVINGAGTENVDLPRARERGVVVATGRGVNADSVADHAMALLLTVVRGIHIADSRIRSGEWAAARSARPLISGKRMGILGLGAVGSEIARRAEGFKMTIAYHNRHRRSDVTYDYKVNPLELAAASDVLMVSCPGGDATRGLVNEQVLRALGLSGFLVNVARGTIVDTAALVEALTNDRIAGAALDVVDGEPEIPAAVLAAPNLVITPHISARSPETIEAATRRVSENLKAHFSGRPLVGVIE